MDLYKKQIYFIVGGFLFCFLFIYIVFFRFSGIDKNTKIQNQSLNTNTGTIVTSVTSKIPDDLENKLKEEGRIKEIDLSFSKDGFFDKSNLKVNLRSNIKVNIDAGNTGLQTGDFLNISIPGADFTSTISIPGRYKYSIYFKQSGEQNITISGSGLLDGNITKKITVK